MQRSLGLPKEFRMELEALVTRMQALYPRIYMACHVEHIRAASSEAGLSSRDSGILAHLTVGALTTPSKLARHLGISNATLSEAIGKLAALGYVRAERSREDERKQKLSLTSKGLEAMKRASVLDARKVRLLLSRLTAKERKKALEGLALLADAALR